jgi:hypothetical protein
VASPNPPPPPPTTTTSTTIPLGGDEPIEEQAIDEDDDALDAAGLPIAVRVVVLAVSVPSLLALLAGGAIVAFKTRRRRQRRQRPDAAGRVSGAWHEALDRYRESGYETDLWATPGEVVQRMRIKGGPPLAMEALSVLADSVDRSAFDARPPEDGDAEVAWDMSDAAVALVRRDVPALQRIRMAVDPRPVARSHRTELRSERRTRLPRPRARSGA